MSLHTLLVLVALGSLDGAARPEDGPGSRPDLARLRELLYNRQAPHEQSQAALLLVQSPAPEAEELVRTGLRRQDRPDVVRALTAAIRLRRDARYLDPLLALLSSEQPELRQAAIEALTDLHNAAVVRKLLALAEDPAAPLAARQAAVTALGHRPQKAAIVALLSLLAADAPAVRQAAADALEELTGQSYGLDALQWQAWWEQAKGLPEEEWLAGRASYLADRARRLRGDLAYAEQHILQLHQMLYSKIPAADRPSHLRTLAQNNYPVVRSQAITWVVEALPDAEGPVQKALVDLLLLLSEDGVEAVQRQAVLALEKAPDPRACERLLVLLQSGSVGVRAAAARSLGRYGAGRTSEGTTSQRAIAALEKALGDPSLVVVAEAAESLGTLGVPETAPILAGLLRHPSDPVRQAAARGLEQVANPQVLAEVQAALEDPVPIVRFSLVGALGKIGTAGNLTDKQKADILQQLAGVLVRDRDPGVRSRAAAVLGDQGTSEQLPILWQRVTATEDNRVQLKAWTAMIDILSRSLNWNLVSQWEVKLSEQKEADRRVEMLTEIHRRWSKLEAAKPHMDPLTAALVQAQLAQRKWPLALPLARDLAKRAPNDVELQKRLRWLLTAGHQAVDDHKPQEVLQMLQDIQDLLPRARDLAPEFETLRQRATTMR